jgi:IclR family transcriptional regulator, pca regulon regulatory protein
MSGRRPAGTRIEVVSIGQSDNPSDGDDDLFPAERSRDFNQSLARGLEIIESFGADAPRQSVSEVAAHTGLTRATVRRFLLTLVDLGYVVSDGRSFALAPRVLGLGYSFISGLGFPNVALPHLERLVAEVDEASEATVLDDHHVAYVCRVPGSKLMTISATVGSRMPAHATSMGRVLLAGLSDHDLDRYLESAPFKRYRPRTVVEAAPLRERILTARVDGYAIVDQELEEGLIAIAVPIHDRSRRVVAAINLSALASSRSATSMHDELLPPLRQTASAIERDLANVV